MTSAPQLTLPGVETAVTALLLSIHREHAERIFRGDKLYELRKALPKQPFHRVYLYESGGGGVVGYFDAAEVVFKPIQDLWSVVGERATTKERFDAYYARSANGYAIRVANPVRFHTPLRPPQLRQYVPAFTAPQSYLLLRPTHPLHEVLETAALEQRGVPRVRLEPIREDDELTYVELVTRHVGKNYEDITASFAHQALRIHYAGLDRSGFLTTKKEVLRIVDDSESLVGFTTLTYKLGGALKTGPTVLLPRYIGRGYGGAARVAIEQHARTLGVRKLYCTAPDSAQEVVSYLLRAGYRVEAHLSRQYAEDHGELVFGRLLSTPGRPSKPRRRRSAASGVVGSPDQFTAKALVESLTRLFAATWFPVKVGFAQRLRRSPKPGSSAYEDKPRELLWLVGRRRCIGACILIPKRGRSVKAILLSETSDPASISSLITSSEKWCSDRAYRKIFYLHPLADQLITGILFESRYCPEGVLSEPYVPGQPVLVMSKMLSDSSGSSAGL